MNSPVSEDVTANTHSAQASRGYQPAGLSLMSFPQPEIISWIFATQDKSFRYSLLPIILPFLLFHHLFLPLFPLSLSLLRLWGAAMFSILDIKLPYLYLLQSYINTVMNWSSYLRKVLTLRSLCSKKSSPISALCKKLNISFSLDLHFLFAWKGILEPIR